MSITLPFGSQVNIINWRGDDLPWNSDLGLINVGQGQYRGGWVKFNNAGAVTSLCGPGRMAGFTGRMPQTHRMWSNDTGEDVNWLTTYFCDLARRGYTNFVGGKLLNGYGEPNGNKGHFTIPYAFPEIGIHKCTIIYGSPQYGLGAPGHGNGNQYINEAGTVTGDKDADVGDAFYYPDLWLTHVTSFLSGVPVGRPWSIYIGDKASHIPITPATRYQNTSISWTDDPGFGVDPRGGSSIQPQFIIDDAETNWNQAAQDSARTDQLNRLRTLRASDDSLKALIDLVESRGELANTIILLSGDQTDYSGQMRQAGGKGTNHWASNALNLRVRKPVSALSPNSECNALVCDADIAATIRHACGAVAKYGEDGMSFAPLLTNPTMEFRKSRPYFNLIKPPEVAGLITAGPVTYGKGVSSGRYPNDEYTWTDRYCTFNAGKNEEFRRETEAMLDMFGRS
jgi:hypothetical protein